jgi:hypothetical protein
MAKEAATKKKIVSLVLDHVLQPPIYKDAVTVKEGSQKMAKVKDIQYHLVGFKVTDIEGNSIVLPMTSVKHFVEEE